MAEPIRQTFADSKRERLVAAVIEKQFPNLVLHGTPPFHPTDFHVSCMADSAKLTYVCDLEVKWFKHSSERAGVFNFNKLQVIMSLPPKTDVKHRICFRFDDGLLIVPAWYLAGLTPYWFTRGDTDETDLVVKVDKTNLMRFNNEHQWLDVLVTERW